jgi:hypothetical protein
VRITWDDANPVYSRGVNQGVLYPQNSPGVPWNGLISVTENGDDTATPLYFDGIRYVNQIVASAFEGTLSAFTYPDEFEPYDGIVSGITGQERLSFGLSYRSSRELHILYGITANPSSDAYASAGGDISPVSFSWAISAIPVNIPAVRPTAHLIVALDQADPASISALEDIIYGDDANDPSLPNPATVLDIFESNTTLRITNNGDGTWTASGPDGVVSMLDADTFQISCASAIFIDSSSYRVYSL